MAKKNTLQLLSYRFDNVVFKRTGHTAKANDARPVDKLFSREITKTSDDEFEYTLKCNLRDTEEYVAPYVFQAEITGSFRLTGWESEEHRYEREVICASTLFPILRAYVATVTINSNAEPLIFGLVNAGDWLNLIDSKKTTSPRTAGKDVSG